jgi:hypothetical protein
VLLRSRPDTIHRFLLCKTQMSTPLIKGSSTAKNPRIGMTPAVADCRYRAPLSPRLRGSVMTYLGETAMTASKSCQIGKSETDLVIISCFARNVNCKSLKCVRQIFAHYLKQLRQLQRCFDAILRIGNVTETVFGIYKRNTGFFAGIGIALDVSDINR